ncbi:hypothetical protein LOZ61_004437 [Ophidiomyces ophidiicola]|nr:hypothetical protein LOZ64_005270 [Ophidiomyces ophidiicola]KAI1910422.1 hypothetical protein LOZ61_004437 [Ophidiomyces ophidiicola]KAI1922455.1 hypothetical protein LOZ60_005679 [Ophidiomyces ophidiicola]KAI2001561.1 hypothetical protein LOZ49_006605 [Ophidiomyces ophidiicola]KAI2001874.1 hypothetical protein LOZ50_005378 [Ophidiomyces ophidiicola]
MPTLLEFLTARDPVLDRSRATKGPNTFNAEWDKIDHVGDWLDFNFENLIAMLEPILNHQFHQHELDIPPQPARATLRIVDEKSVTNLLSKSTHTRVDCALEKAFHLLAGRMMPISWASGGHAKSTDEVTFPDWAGIDLNDEFPAVSRVPGDTKVSGKWHTNMRHDTTSIEFLKPLCQVMNYAKIFNTRYAYVVSDSEVVCLRRTISEYEGTPLALSRSRRSHLPTTPIRQSSQILPATSTPPPPRTPPVQVVIRRPQRQDPQPFLTPERARRPPNILFSPPNNISSSPSAYTDNGNPDIDEGIVEMAIIPWGETRPNQLTVNLAIFWIHILAAFDIEMQSSYPPLGRNLAREYGMFILIVKVSFLMTFSLGIRG